MKLLKVILTIAFIYFGLLYLTRPPMEITSENFRTTLQNMGYKVGYARTEGANTAYIASKDRITINYAKFNSNEDAYNFYLNFISKQTDKHSEKSSKDIYLTNPSAEKQSFISDYDRYYAAIYAQDTVIYSNNHKENIGNVDDVYSVLYQPSKFDFTQSPAQIMQLFTKK